MPRYIAFVTDNPSGPLTREMFSQVVDADSERDACTALLLKLKRTGGLRQAWLWKDPAPGTFFVHVGPAAPDLTHLDGMPMVVTTFTCTCTPPEPQS